MEIYLSNIIQNRTDCCRFCCNYLFMFPIDIAFVFYIILLISNLDSAAILPNYIYIKYI